MSRRETKSDNWPPRSTGWSCQLRDNQRVRETFGKYIDPRVVEGLIDRPNLTAAEGQRRVMTVLFCDLKGFTSLSEGMTPQGLVKVMNRYLSIMSEPIRTNRGIIDKYIGDGIMAYWGPPFVDEADHARFACLAALEMIERIATLRQEIPEMLGVRGTPMERCDLRIGVATGEALVGSIGSDVMMSYTVMGDVVNLASRLEGANKTIWHPQSRLRENHRRGGRRRRGSRDRSGRGSGPHPFGSHF